MAWSTMVWEILAWQNKTNYTTFASEIDDKIWGILNSKLLQKMDSYSCPMTESSPKQTTFKSIGKNKSILLKLCPYLGVNKGDTLKAKV